MHLNEDGLQEKLLLNIGFEGVQIYDQLCLPDIEYISFIRILTDVFEDKEFDVTQGIKIPLDVQYRKMG
jgi:hypothetical protein